jgi:hypothetical protein
MAIADKTGDQVGKARGNADWATKLANEAEAWRHHRPKTPRITGNRVQVVRIARRRPATVRAATLQHS